MTAKTRLAPSEPYLGLIPQFPLRPIRTEEELARAIAVVTALVDRAGAG
jgi:hypothetical protein